MGECTARTSRCKGLLAKRAGKEPGLNPLNSGCCEDMGVNQVDGSDDTVVEIILSVSPPHSSHDRLGPTPRVGSCLQKG